MKKSYQSFVHDLLNSDILVPYFFVDAFDFSTGYRINIQQIDNVKVPVLNY
jgi:uncharacterized membrane protein YGL010W